jgi:hypothetical protein
MGCTFAKGAPVTLFFFQYQQYRKYFKLLCISFVVNGCTAKSTIAARSFDILLYCSQSGANGIILSHSQSVVPYG